MLKRTAPFRTCVRVRVRARARTVFQAEPPPAKVVTIEDIDSLMVLTHNMPEKKKREMFYEHGVDYDNVREYYDAVVFMDRMYRQSPREPPEKTFARYYEYMRRIVIVFLLIVSGRF